MMLQLAYLDRTLTSADTGAGIFPALALDDVAGGKAAALAVRSFEHG
jgi:hypothetical protein